MSIVLKQFPIDQASKDRLSQVRLSIFNDSVNALAERVYVGDISIGQWQEQMKAEIRSIHSSLAAIGKGGWDQMTWSDWGRVGAEVKKQYRYLQGFAEHIAANRDSISLSQISARARMYGNASKHTAYLMEANGLDKLKVNGSLVLPWIPGDGSTECLTNCKCFWDIKQSTKNVARGKKMLTAVWTLSPAEHCKDCIARKGYTITAIVDDNYIVPDMIGGY